MNRQYNFTILLIIIFLALTQPQDAYTQEQQKSAFSTHAYADLFVGHDFNKLPTRERPYTTQARYDDELALNLGYLDLALEDESIRGRLALQHGSSVIANYAAEPDLFFRYIQESFIGFQIAPDLWLDAGIFLSHIGIESWISKDNWTYTRSFIAENSPYYQSGARLSYRIDNELALQLHALRGWQNISDDKNLAIGTQIKYQPSERTTLTHNTFLGDEQGERLFNNFIAQHDLTKKWSIAASYDIGVQRRRFGQDTAIWHGGAGFARYRASDTTRLGARIEHYRDPNQVILSSVFDGPIAVTGFSLNVDVDLCPNLLWRTEYRALVDSDKIFPNGSSPKDTNHLLVTSLAISM